MIVVVVVIVVISIDNNDDNNNDDVLDVADNGDNVNKMLLAFENIIIKAT